MIASKPKKNLDAAGLREARKRLGLSQTTMAARLELAFRTYQRLEHGRKPITRGIVLQVHELLELEENQDVKRYG